MSNKLARRWLAGLGAIGLTGAMLATTTAPASADPSGPELDVYFNNTLVAAGGNGTVDAAILYASEPTVLHEATVTYDATGLAGVAEIAEEDGGVPYCTTPSTNVLVCQVPYELEVEEWGLHGPFDIVITPMAGAVSGDEGTLKVSFGAAGFETVTHDATVRVGEGVDLAAGATAKVTTAPGEAFTSRLAVRNVGTTTAKGTTAVFFNDYAIRAGKKFSNCTYVGDELRSCRFDTDLEPGGAYTAALPYRLGADAAAPGGAYGEMGWMTPAEFENFRTYLDSRGVSIGQPGTDGELTLSSTMGTLAQVDTDPTNNWSYLEVTVTGENGADLAAIGDTVSGEAGDTVTATVGFQNNGPATIDATRSGSSITRLDLTVPAGTTAVEVPADCVPMNGDEVDWEHPGKTGAAAYRCYAGSFVAAGEKQTVDFALRIDKVINNATGTVRINAKCQCEGWDKDLDPANDLAKLMVNPTDDGGEGGMLPVTGSSAGIIAGAGALLLTAGGVSFVIARRRRMRFVA